MFRDYGYRRLRSRARLKFLVAGLGRGEVPPGARGRSTSTARWSTATLPPVARRAPATTSASTSRRTAGSTSASRRPSAASTARRWSGSPRSPRSTARTASAPRRTRSCSCSTSPRTGSESLVAALDEIGLSARPSNWRRSTMACTGIEFCKLAIVETKQRAADLIAELEQRFPDLDIPITVNVNGCPNACARTQVADIGLKGQLVLDADGNQVEGYQVHLGGGLGLEPQFGKKLRAHKVTSTGLDDYVTNVVSAFLEQRDRGRAVRDLGRPRRRRRAARRGRPPRAGGRLVSAARHPVPLPLLRRREPPPQRGGLATAPLGVPRLPARLLAQDARHDRTAPPGPRCRDDHCHHRSSPRLQGHEHRGTHRGRAQAARPARRRRARARSGRGDHRVGRRDVRRALRDHLLHGRRGARARRRPGRPGRRRGVPRHRLPLRRDHRHPRRRRGDAAGEPDQHHPGPVGGRAGRDVRQGPVRPGPRPVLRAAQGQAARGRAGRRTTPGPPACAATRPTTG